MEEGMVLTLILILSFPEKRDEYLTYIATLPCYVYICTCGSQSGFTPPSCRAAFCHPQSLWERGRFSLLILILSFPEERDDYLTDIATFPLHMQFSFRLQIADEVKEQYI